ncbi:MAG: hypothetical protein HKO59_06230 [Phycisphaerales bacterium]|nr:metallophosphoesterase [Phycisphaerae bacterium]NNF43284.1 hypothetical protein [Phycisphaerales bacterium]NNM25571.1 hypothetical protein [Phycisphaerales bacterium]
MSRCEKGWSFRSSLPREAVAWAAVVGCIAASAGAGDAGGDSALQFDGVTSHVTMGVAPMLNLPEFTIETWFRYDGGGQATATAWTHGTAYPIVTKGRREADGSVERDFNYFLGIRASTRLLVADFENKDTFAAGWNHPVVGTTVIEPGVWHHVAAAYDGYEWRLYLDGTLEMNVVHDAAAQDATTQHFAIGAALDAEGSVQGRFAGAIDEVRVWSIARTAADIRATMNESVTSAPGLVGRWGLNEGDGTSVADSSGNDVNGIIVGNAAWIDGAPFDVDRTPDPPGTACPPDRASRFGTSQPLSVTATDPDGGLLDVTFYGRVKKPRPGAYTLVVIPDTQHYVRPIWWPEHFPAMTNWIMSHRETLNIPYVGHVGDIVHNASLVDEWEIANAAISVLDADPTLAYGLTVGNHDEFRFGDPKGTGNFNLYFPYTRYEGVVPWYGGHFGDDNDNHYVLFESGGDRFLAVHLEFRNPAPTDEVLAWTDDLLATHPDRRAIIVLHEAILAANAGEQARWDDQGEAVYDTLKHRPNLFLIFAGHRLGEGRRVDTFEGRTVHTLMHNFQLRPEGGEGFLRLYELASGDDEIVVKTYSPSLGTYETDPDSDFSLGTDTPGGPWTYLDQVTGVPSGSIATTEWTGLDPGTTYEWRVEIKDAAAVTVGPATRLTIPACFANFDNDEVVGISDLLAVLSGWGPCSGPCPSCRVDLDGDGVVSFSDLLALLTAWGPCP